MLKFNDLLEDCEPRDPLIDDCKRRQRGDPKRSQSDYRETSQSEYQRHIKELDCDIIEVLQLLMTASERCKETKTWQRSTPPRLPKATGPNDEVRKFNLIYIDDTVKVLQTTKNNLKGMAADFDPPIDTLSHQVQFVLTLTGSATPTWTLARFKGPGPASGGLLSGVQTNTHTLTIVLGSNQIAVNQKTNAFSIGTAINNANIAPKVP
jgi:hypothetical protein